MLDRCRDWLDKDQFDKVDSELRALLVREPDSVEGLKLQGISLIKQGRVSEGNQSLSRAVALAEEDTEALTWLALGHRLVGRLDEAIEYSFQAISLDSSRFEAFNVLGVCLLAKGLAEDAKKALLRAYTLRPKDVATLSNLAMAYRLLNEGQMALELFQAAMLAEPSRAQHHIQVGRQLVLLGRLREAAVQLEASVLQHPASVGLADLLASTYGRLGRNKAAERIFERIFRLNAASANNYAIYLQEEGRFEESISVLKDSLNLQPLQGEAYRLLVEAGISELDGTPLTERVVELTENPALDDRSKMHLGYALGKILDKGGDASMAMSWFDLANSRALESYPACQGFDPSSIDREVRATATIYSDEFFRALQAEGRKGVRPIFIVGMIRSGTTLLDQFLGSHPDISSIGECPFWGAEADPVHVSLKKAPLTQEQIDRLADGYLASIAWTKHLPRFTDKMPLNYRHIGLIRAVFPEAKFVHIRRDPFDTCLSVYTTFFAGGPSFAYDPEHIRAFYLGYLATMRHWRSILPSSVLFELDYEHLLADPEGVMRRVIEFVELEWASECLSHEKKNLSIPTPSRWQARQPIYFSSIGKRARYAAYAPVLSTLPESFD